MSRTLLAAVLAVVGAAAAPLASAAPPALPASPFAASPEIEVFSRRARLHVGDTRARIGVLVDLIFDEKYGLGFTYQRSPTLDAARAFERREGNCLTLVNLFVAMARSADIPAEFVQVTDYEVFYREGGAIVRSTHVVGGVRLATGMLTVDFLPDRPKRYRGLRPISDDRATAYFHNALATEAMLAGDLDGAAAAFERALELDPGYAEIWNNYGVLLKRRGDLDGALDALERSHALDRRFLPAMENLASFHRALGEPRRAERFEKKALEERTRNPFFLVQLALQEMARGETEAAEGHLKRARRIDPGIPEIYLVQGRIQLARGEREKADRLFEEARAKSAAFSETFQSRLQSKIDRLIGEEPAEPRALGEGAENG